MNKVLIIGPSFFYFNQSIADAFDALGWETQIVSFDEPVHPFHLKNKILHKFSPRKEKLKEKSRRLFNTSIQNRFDLFAPDLVFIYNGDILEPETICYFKTKSKVAIWMLDGLSRHPRSEALAPLVDGYFCFEPDDVETLRQKGIDAHFLPQACDTSIYHPIDVGKDIDILFVGALYGYPKRIEYLKAVVDHFPDKKIEIYGVYKPIYKNPIKWLFREKRAIYKNKNIPPEEVNGLYNRAKICLNIHHEQSTNGANPKVFEIAGAGAFQLVDWNPYIASLFPEEMVTTFQTKQELILTIEKYLAEKKSIQRHQDYEEVMKYHTFKERIASALRVIG
ncbi:glycosyltransferase [Parabacteroides sp. OttesenSCG-928-O15]|nr:glycosyltransferase [Parabacteroides sp. OttesenSCG-928-O15]